MVLVLLICEDQILSRCGYQREMVRVTVTDPILMQLVSRIVDCLELGTQAVSPDSKVGERGNVCCLAAEKEVHLNEGLAQIHPGEMYCFVHWQ